MSKEQVVLVTGGASGLGAALVESFARKGCCVVMNYRDENKAKDAPENNETIGIFIAGISTLAVLKEGESLTLTSEDLPIGEKNATLTLERR